MKTAETKKKEKLTGSRIIMVRIYMPEGRDQFHFFGSLSAVYEKFNAKQLGVALGTLYVYGLAEDRPWFGLRCAIYRSTIYRKKQSR